MSYIAARCEKKGIPAESIKNYEQVRHYYYRMWHKISQMLKISNGIKQLFIIRLLNGLCLQKSKRAFRSSTG